MRRATGATGSALVILASLAPASSWALWGDRLQLYASENIAYDSNVFRTSLKLDPQLSIGASGRGDTLATTAVGFSLDVPVSLQRFQLGYRWFTSRYNTFTDLDHDGHSLNAAWLWAVTPWLTGDVGYQETRNLASFADIQGRRPDLVTDRMAYANAAWLMTPSWRLHGAVTGVRTEHEDPLRAPANDVENVAVEAGVSYISRQENRIGVAVRREEGKSPHLANLPGAPFDNAYVQTGIGVQGRWVVSGLSRLDGRLDYTRREYDQFTQRNYSGPTFRATYTWTPTGKFTLAATAQRDVAPLESISQSFVLVTGITLRPDWAVTDKINVRGVLAYNVWDYRGDAVQGLDFTHRVRTGGISIVYRPTQHISLVGGFTREVRASTAPFGDYEANVSSLEARVGF